MGRSADVDAIDFDETRSGNEDIERGHDSLLAAASSWSRDQALRRSGSWISGSARDAPPTIRYSFNRYWMVRMLMPSICAALVVEPFTASSVVRIAYFSI